MFQGSENFNDEYFKPFEQVGATGRTARRAFDRTNYFQNVPTTALDLAMWMESDRMGHLLGAIDQPRLDEQRGVVQNEKRQNENRPYGRVFERMLAATLPGRTIPITGCRSARWTISTPRRSTTSRSGSGPITGGERGARAGGRHRYAEGTRTGTEILRRHPAGSRDHAAADLDQ